MKISNAIVAVMILAAIPSYGQSNDGRAVAAAVEKLRKAMLDGDRTTLEAITSPDLSYGHSSGKIEDRTAFVEALASGASDFVTINLTNQTIKIAGNVALVRHELHGELSTGPVNLGVLLVWQKEKNVWHLLARQAFKL